MLLKHILWKTTVAQIENNQFLTISLIERCYRVHIPMLSNRSRVPRYSRTNKKSDQKSRRELNPSDWNDFQPLQKIHPFFLLFFSFFNAYLDARRKGTRFRIVRNYAVLEGILAGRSRLGEFLAIVNASGFRDTTCSTVLLGLTPVERHPLSQLVYTQDFPYWFY